MKTVLQIVKRDFLRLLKAPAALIVVAALIILPSLYTWVNVYGFWNPYDNTQNMRVCFVTEDKGGNNALTGELNLGDMIDETLRDNNQLGWAFVSRDEAMEEVRSGKAYAAFVVPENFTEDLLTILTSDFKSPSIEYYVNEKLGPVSPKISDAGSTTLDETINSTFVKTVSETIVEKLNDAILKANDTLNEKDEQVVEKLESAKNALSNSKAPIEELENSIIDVQGQVDQGNAKLAEVDSGIDKAVEGLKKVQDGSREATEALQRYSDVVYPAVTQGAIKLAEASQSTYESVNELSSNVQSTTASVKTALAEQKLNVEELKLLVNQLKNASASLPEGDVKNAIDAQIDSLEAQISANEQNIENLETLADDIDDSSKKLTVAAAQVNTTVKNATDASLEFNATLFQTTLPALNRSINDVASTSGKLSVAVNNQHTLVDQTKVTLEQVNKTLSAAYQGLDATKKSIEMFEDEFSTLQTDISSFSLGQMLKKVAEAGGLDATSIGDFLSSPTIVEEKNIYELNAYGSAMAPLFMNLTFWIGAFMLLVILRQEVDSEGFEKLTIAQRYVSRWLLLTIFAVLQAVLCVIGVLALGVQTVNVALLFLISALASIAYLTLMFMLSTTLQHVGKGVCVLLAFLQIPGATGLYPVEMTTPFFQSVYPFFPFTYGINGLRETICGFYGETFGFCCAVLLGITVVSMFIGIYLRPYLTNFNKLFAKQIREGGLFVGEEIEIPTQRFRISQLIGFLANRDEYKVGLERRAMRFVRHYAAFKRYALAAAIFLSVALAILFAQLSYEYKPTLLTIWLVGLVVLMIVLVGVEHAYDSIERQMNLDSLSDDDLRGLFKARDEVGKTTSEVFEKQKEGKGHKLMQRAKKEFKELNKDK